MFLGTPEEPSVEPQVATADAGLFRTAMRRFASTVSIITCNSEGCLFGMAATAVTSLSADPPALLVCVNKTAATHRALAQGRHFCVNVLCSRHIDVSRAFGGQFRGENRFEIGDWRLDENGLPYVHDAQANMFCAIERTMEYATHTIFIARVYSTHVLEKVDPLIFQDGMYMKTTPIL
jgi:flavin reductase (DIM6/NTAB) family NADH-FMN oxidoreductase RutF